MRFRLFNVKYSPNLGDGLLSECLEMALKEHGADAAATYSVDLAGRVAYSPGPASRTRILSSLAYMPPLLRSIILRPILSLEKHRRWAPHYTKNMVDCDCVVIGGGNLFTDMDLNFPIKICEVLHQAAASNLPVAIYGVGVGSQWSAAGRRMMVEALARVDLFYASVRDAASQANFLNLFGRVLQVPVSVVRDPGLLISRYVMSETLERDAPIGICLTSSIAIRYHSNADLDDDTLLRWYLLLLDKLVASGFHVMLFTNGSPEDVAFSARFSAISGDVSRTVVLQPTVPSELASVIASCAAVVGFRMHALIAGASYGRVLIGLEWDPKLNAFMESLSLGDQIFNVSKTDPDAVAHRLAEMCNDNAERTPSAAIEESFRDVRGLVTAYSAHSPRVL